MPKKKKQSIDYVDAFGDDFEVTYEGDNPFNQKLESKSFKRNSKKEIDLSIVDIDTDDFYDDDIEENDYNDEYEEEYDTDEISSSKSRNRVTPIAAPLKKGGKKAYHMLNSLLRNLSLILIIAIIILLVVDFIRGSAVYGDIYEQMKAQEFSIQLISYFAVAAVLIIYELIAALITMTKVKVRDMHGVHREDAGKGLSCFVFTYISSYAAFLINSHIPELNEIFYGIKGALAVYGSMHNVLFGICLAGVISCLIRKHYL